MPEDQWLERIWLGKLKEVVNLYHPDLIFFDGWLNKIPEEKQREFCAYYLNRAAKLGKEVVITYKDNDLPREVGINALVKRRSDHRRIAENGTKSL